jgi:hypothetical protein
VDWFNHRWLLEPIGNIPPAEFETANYREEVEPVTMQDSKNRASGNPGRFSVPSGGGSPASAGWP